LPLIDITDHGAGIAWTVERVVGLSERFENVGVVVDPGRSCKRSLLRQTFPRGISALAGPPV
jgi:hypothetical protein